MGFDIEPSRYEKTILSELQGAWQCLRDEVVSHAGFTGWDKVLFHVDEAMSWESVRNLHHMNRCLVLIRNRVLQGNAPGEELGCLDSVNELMAETLELLGDHASS